VVHPSPFIIPAQPVLRDRPPKGEGWLHEVKFDGYRVHLHKEGKDVAIYSRNGINFNARFPDIAHALAHFPVKAIIIDAEAVACNAKGMPDFSALHGREAKPEDICCWAFAILQHNSLDTRSLPLIARRAKLEKILARFDNSFVRFSETFSYPAAGLGRTERQRPPGEPDKRLAVYLLFFFSLLPWRSSSFAVSDRYCILLNDFRVPTASFRRMRELWLDSSVMRHQLECSCNCP
jgi:hypothetical protein